MGLKNFYEKVWDFDGHHIFTTTAGDNAPFMITKTAAGGSPTFALQNASAGAVGEFGMAMAATNEVENLCLSQNDILQYLAGQLIEVEFRLKMQQATLNAASQFAFGIATARNDAIASITNSALFQLVGASNVVKVSTRDGTNTNNVVATNQTLGTTYRDFCISFATGLSDVRFLVDGVPAVLTGVTAVNMSALSATQGFQLYAQIQKTASTPTDGVTIDRISVRCRRQ